MRRVDRRTNALPDRQTNQPTGRPVDGRTEGRTKPLVQGEHSQMQKSIKLLWRDASSS